MFHNSLLQLPGSTSWSLLEFLQLKIGCVNNFMKLGLPEWFGLGLNT